MRDWNALQNRHRPPPLQTDRPTDRALHNSGYDWEIVEERKRRGDQEGAEEEEEEEKQDGKPIQRTCGSRMV